MFTKNQWIAVAAIIVPSIIIVIGWFLVNKNNTITSPSSPCSIGTVDQNGGTNTVNCDPSALKKPVTESFCPDQSIHFVMQDDKKFVEVKLKYIPLQDSIVVWERGTNISPDYFKSNGNLVDIQVTPNTTADSFKVPCSQDHGVQNKFYTIKYIPE